MAIKGSDICGALGGIGTYTLLRRIERAVRPARRSFIGNIGVLFIEVVATTAGVGFGSMFYEKVEAAVKKVLKESDSEYEDSGESRETEERAGDDIHFTDGTNGTSGMFDDQMDFSDWLNRKGDALYDGNE